MIMFKKLSIAVTSTTIAILEILGTTQKAEAILIGLYEFNDSNNLGLDTSGNNQNATNNGAVFDASGYEGGAASFNGSSSFLSVSTNVNPSVLPQLTWGAWVKPNSTTGIRAVLSADNGGFDRTINIDSRAAGNWGAFTGTGVFNSGVNPSTTDWTFLAAVYDESSDSLTYYVNEQSFSTSTNFGTSNNFFEIGRNPFTGGVEHFDGLIDNVFVYNQALSAQEISNIRTSGLASVPFEFSPSLGLLLVGGLVGSTHFYRNHQTKKVVLNTKE